MRHSFSRYKGGCIGNWQPGKNQREIVVQEKQLKTNWAFIVKSLQGLLKRRTYNELSNSFNCLSLVFFWLTMYPWERKRFERQRWKSMKYISLLSLSIGFVWPPVGRKIYGDPFFTIAFPGKWIFYTAHPILINGHCQNTENGAEF